MGHLRLKKAGLYVYDGKSIKKIISHKNIKSKVAGKDGQALICFSKPTSIGGMIVNFKDEVVLVASEIGLFSYKPGQFLKNLWIGKLIIRYKMPTYQVSSSPQGIVELGNKLYVASRSLGVFSFETHDSGKIYPIKQIVFIDKFSNKANSADTKKRAAD